MTHELNIGTSSDILTARDVARELGISLSMAQTHMRKQTIPSTKLAERLITTQEALDEYKLRRRGPGNPDFDGPNNPRKRAMREKAARDAQSTTAQTQRRSRGRRLLRDSDTKQQTKASTHDETETA